ncbi:hypothetical protein AMJ80_01620 [bacterium SM23_31]|nr:MAG: hypothetical protein AMJ80_01620 [bacterium SM23_31]
MLRIPGGNRAKFLTVGMAILTLGLIVYLGYKSTAIEVETFEAIRGEFIVDVVASGEFKSLRSTKIAGPSGLGEIKIIDLAPENEYVEKGDFLIQFDDSYLEERLYNYKSTLATKYQELEVLLAQQRTDSVRRGNQLKKDQLQLELDKIGSLSSQFDAEIEKQRDQIGMHMKELQLLDKADEIESKKLENREKLIIKYEEIKRYEKYVDDYTKRLGETTVYAPVPGMVVYLEVYMGLGVLSREKVRVGATSIFYGEPFIELSDLSEMLVKTAVNEIEVGKIKRNQEVIVKLDTDERIYYGTVSRIATLAEKVYVNPNTRNEFRNLYTVEIAIKNSEENTENNGALIPGMSATCTIITDRLQDAVYIPIQSVFEAENETFVYVKDGGTYKKSPIVTGVKNKDYVVIKKGLESGQIVALRDPYKKLQGIGTELKEKQLKPATAKKETGEVPVNMPVVIIRDP